MTMARGAAERYHCYAIAHAFPRNLAVVGLGRQNIRAIGLSAPRLRALVTVADGDVPVTVEAIVAHHAAVSRLAALVPSIPVRFHPQPLGRAQLIRRLRRDATGLSHAIEQLADTLEFGLCYRSAAVPAPPIGGRARLVAKTATLRAEHMRDEAVEHVLDGLGRLLAAPVRWKDSADLHWRTASLLVPRHAAGALQTALAAQLVRFGSIDARVTGPFPPYSFGPSLR